MTLHRALLLGAFAAGLTLPAQAQEVSPFSLGVDFTAARVVREAATTRILSGPVLGAGARVSLARFELEGHYAEGSLSPDGSGSTASESFVDARLAARVRLLSWLSVGAGPHIRAFVTPSGTARWQRLELTGRVTSELINDLALLVVDAWIAPMAESNVQGGGTGARGGEAGLLLRIPGTPTAVQLSYFADRGSYANGGGEFLEGVRVALVLDRILQPRPR